MSETAAQQTIPAVTAPAAQAPAATTVQPTAQSAQPAAPAVQGAPVTNVTVNLPPDLLRMAGLQQPAAASAPAATTPATPAQPPVPPAAEPAKATDAAPAQPAATTQATPAVQAPDASALQAQLSEMRAQYRATVIRAEVERVALTGGAINSADVLKLVADELDVAADGRVIAKGDPRVSGEQHVARFLAARPHMLKPLVQGGGAGAPATVTPPAAPPAVKLDMTTADGATKLARQIAAARGYLPAPKV